MERAVWVREAVQLCLLSGWLSLLGQTLFWDSTSLLSCLVILWCVGLIFTFCVVVSLSRVSFLKIFSCVDCAKDNSSPTWLIIGNPDSYSSPGMIEDFCQELWKRHELRSKRLANMCDSLLCRIISSRTSAEEIIQYVKKEAGSKLRIQVVCYYQGAAEIFDCIFKDRFILYTVSPHLILSISFWKPWL